jgi:argininosuccinate lyase
MRQLTPQELDEIERDLRSQRCRWIRDKDTTVLRLIAAIRERDHEIEQAQRVWEESVAESHRLQKKLADRLAAKDALYKSALEHINGLVDRLAQAEKALEEFALWGPDYTRFTWQQKARAALQAIRGEK